MQSLRTELGAEIRDKQGRLIQKIPFRACHSLLKQFIQVLAVNVSQASINIKSIDGTEYATAPSSANFRANPAAGPTNYGIVIGTGNTAVTIDDYKLSAQLTASISYLASIIGVDKPDSSTWRMSMTRGFLNNTGAQVEIKEVGWISFNATKPSLLDRTLYNVTFESGETLTLTYRIVITL